METTISNLKVGQKFRTVSGNTVYTVKDIVKGSDGKSIWLLTGGYYVEKHDKKVVPAE
jgi:hypothetical protein